MMDEYLKAYAEKYEKWREGGTFTVSSRVVPVQESLHAQQWILHGEQLLRVLRDARSFALTDCRCRGHYGRCEKPRDVCFLIDDLADKAVARNMGRRITFDDARKVLEKADRYGLVHLTLYEPGGKIYALCSCCSCCCHDLQLLLAHGRRDLVARSDYIAVTERERCTDCGKCVDRCIFGARSIQNGELVFRAESCLGCGLCVSPCPEHATTMQERAV